MVEQEGYIRDLGASQAFSSMFNDASSGAANNPAAPQQTLLQKIGVNVQPPAVNAGAMMRDASMAAPDLPQVQAQAATATQDVKAVRADAEAGFNQAVAIAVGVAREVAADTPALGVAPDQVNATFAKNCPTMEMASAAAGQGLGSAVTAMMNGTALIAEAKNDAKNMSAAEVKGLMDEVATRISGQQSVAQKTNIMSGSAPAGPMDFSNAQCDLSGLTGDDLTALLEANFEQLPEIAEMDATLSALEAVHDNHLAVAVHHEETGLAADGTEFGHSSRIDAAALSDVTVIAANLAAAPNSYDGSAQWGVAGSIASMFGLGADEPPVYNNEAGLEDLGVQAANWGTTPSLPGMRA